MTRPLFIVMALATALAGCTTTTRAAHHHAPPMGQEASIPFLNHRGVDNWAADGTRGIYLQDAFRRWYYARLFAPCTELPFATRIGIETRGNDTLDRFGTIIVRGQRCQIDSLVTSGPPPKKSKRHKNSVPDKADKDAEGR